MDVKKIRVVVENSGFKYMIVGLSSSSTRFSGINADRIFKSRRSNLYVWEIIAGPECLIGRLVKPIDMTYGGWTNDEIHYRNIHTGEIRVMHDSIEPVI